MNKNSRKAYIARYSLNETKTDLIETILSEDTYWSEKLSKDWDVLVSQRTLTDPMLQGWYSDAYQVNLMATTNQPFQLA